MKRILLILAILLPALLAKAQVTWMPVTASSCITDASGAVMASGTFTATPTDQNDVPLDFITNDSKSVSAFTVQRTITNGSITDNSFTLANPAITNPINIRYRISVKDNTTQRVRTYKNVAVVGNDSGNTVFNWCKMNNSVALPTLPSVNQGVVGPTGPVGPLAQGDIFIGNASAIPTDKALSGDCTLSYLGVITCVTANSVPIVTTTGSQLLTNKTTTTQSAGDNSAKLASTAYVNNAAIVSGQSVNIGGFIIKWGTTVLTSGGQTISFSSAFPNNVFSVSLTCQNGVASVGVDVSSTMTSGFTAYASGYPVGVSYIAIGN